MFFRVMDIHTHRTCIQSVTLFTQWITTIIHNEKELTEKTKVILIMTII